MSANYKNMPNQIGEVTANSRLYTNVLAGAQAFTPSDSASLTKTSRGIFVGTAGDMTVQMEDGSNVLFANIGNSVLLPIRANKILDTGTDATEITVIY